MTDQTTQPTPQSGAIFLAFDGNPPSLVRSDFQSPAPDAVKHTAIKSDGGLADRKTLRLFCVLLLRSLRLRQDQRLTGEQAESLFELCRKLPSGPTPHWVTDIFGKSQGRRILKSLLLHSGTPAKRNWVVTLDPTVASRYRLCVSYSSVLIQDPLELQRLEHAIATRTSFTLSEKTFDLSLNQSPPTVIPSLGVEETPATISYVPADRGVLRFCISLTMEEQIYVRLKIQMGKVGTRGEVYLYLISLHYRPTDDDTWLDRKIDVHGLNWSRWTSKARRLGPNEEGFVDFIFLSTRHADLFHVATVDPRTPSWRAFLWMTGFYRFEFRFDTELGSVRRAFCFRWRGNISCFEDGDLFEVDCPGIVVP